LCFAFDLVRRRIGWRAIAAAGIVFGAIGGLTLVILRLQLGRWFATGYSISEIIYPWNKFAYSFPKPNEYKWGIPLGTGAYCWWPCSPAVGLLGVAALRRTARRFPFVFFVSYVPFLAFYTALEVGRGWDFGYGPRYELPLVVPMAVGTGVVLAHLWARATAKGDESAFARGGPVAVALAAVLVGVVRLAPLMYPPVFADVKGHNRLRDAIDDEKLKNAVVIGGAGLQVSDLKDLPENLPLSYFPDQDVLVAIDSGPETSKCVRQLYPHRTVYRAVPSEPIRFTRF
jgi:hypothetical protein